MRYVVLATLVLAGCGTTTITARETLTPVMLGPVHYVGPNQGKLTHGIDRRTFDAEYGVAGRGGVNAFTGQLDMTIPHGLELALADAPPDFMLSIKPPIECRLTHIFAVLVTLVTNSCRLDAQQITPKIPSIE
jgi:hypothetical protein